MGDDYVGGGAGGDRLFGEEGADDLWGNADNDTMTGGGGRDVFHFSRGDGQDVVTDFVVHSRVENDKIAFNGGVFTSCDQVMAASEQVGADTVFRYGDGDTITLQGVDRNFLDPNFFVLS